MRPIKSIVLCVALLGSPVLADEAPKTGNAALRYWQAFSFLPSGPALDKLEEIDPASKEGEELSQSLKSSLETFHRGAQFNQCDWGLDYELGYELALPHLSKARALARSAMFESKRARAMQDTPRSWALIGDTLTLSRHLQTDPLIINDLVSVAIQHLALTEAARHATTDSPEQLKALVKRMDAAPPQAQLKAYIETEKKFGLDVLRRTQGNPAALQELVNGAKQPTSQPANAPVDPGLQLAIKGAEEAYDRLSACMALPPAERAAAIDKVLADTSKKGDMASIFIQTLLPALKSWQSAHFVGEVEVQMFRAGAAVISDGEAELKKFLDPTDGQPFTYQKTEGGFTLTSRFVRKDKPVTMTFGQAADHSSKRP